MSLNFPPKDPDEVLDYQVDWYARLAGDTIQSSTWTADAGITVNSNSFTTSTTTIWLSGGKLSVSYILLNRIVTVGGRTMDQSITINIASR